MSNSYAHELVIGGVYFSPLLIVFIFAFLATVITTVLLNRLKIAAYIFNPPLAFVAIMILYIVCIDHYWIKI